MPKPITRDAVEVNSIELNGQIYDCQQLIEQFSQQVRPERLQRIQDVIDRRNPNLVTVMENIYDRGNTSAVMRSAEAFGFHLFHQIVEINEFKESKRVTQGADKWLVQSHWQKTTDCIHSLKKQGYRIVVTHLEGGQPIHEIDFDQPTALCFGSEKEGASPLLTEMADARVFIPMQGFVQSFNISVAAALCFQHIHHQMQKYDLPGLSAKERQQLLALYLYRSVKNPTLPLPLS